MNVDLHTHTFPASTCSHISLHEYVACCLQLGVEAVALTNHGDIADNLTLGPALAEEGILLLDGVEISTLFGDFVIFSGDRDYLATLRDLQDAPRPGSVPADAAVVWVHPAAGGGRSGSAYYPGLERMVAGVVDAVEVYNGTWSGDRFVAAAEAIAAQLGVARTGGSDAHNAAEIMTCYTEVPWEVRSTADLVTALKRGLTVPHRTPAPRRRRFGLF